jgi:hypothetical protein
VPKHAYVSLGLAFGQGANLALKLDPSIFVEYLELIGPMGESALLTHRTLANHVPIGAMPSFVKFMAENEGQWELVHGY